MSFYEGGIESADEIADYVIKEWKSKQTIKSKQRKLTKTNPERHQFDIKFFVINSSRQALQRDKMASVVVVQSLMFLGKH